MNDRADLYHDAIMALARAGTGAGTLADADASFTVNNPLCGDRVTMAVKLADQRVAQIAHKVRGCALCQAAAAMIADQAPGLTVDAVNHAADAAEAMLKNREETVPEGGWAAMDAFRPVADHRSRHDCVLLPFRALVEALRAARP